MLHSTVPSKAQSKYKAGELKGIEIGEANKVAFAEDFAEKKLKEEKLAIARKCKQMGMPIADILELTGLTEEEILGIDV